MRIQGAEVFGDADEVPTAPREIRSRFAAAMSLEDDKAGLIPKAGQLLTTLAFCRSQAEALHTCTQGKGPCRRENDMFLKCATDAAPKVVQTMIKIAVEHCPEEVRAHQACKQAANAARFSPSGAPNCAEEDLAAMWCASHVVLKTAAEETRQAGLQ